MTIINQIEYEKDGIKVTAKYISEGSDKNFKVFVCLDITSEYNLSDQDLNSLVFYALGYFKLDLSENWNIEIKHYTNQKEYRMSFVPRLFSN